MFDWTDFLTALGLVFILEGTVYALFPVKVQEMMRLATELPSQTLRNFGIGALIVGAIIVWFIRG